MGKKGKKYCKNQMNISTQLKKKLMGYGKELQRMNIAKD